MYNSIEGCIPRIFFVAMFSLVAIFSDSAKAEKTIDDCASVQDDHWRLECYDVMFRKSKEVHLITSESNWTVILNKSKIDDSTNVYISNKSIEKHVNRFGKSEYLDFYIACREGVTSIWIIFAGEFMASGSDDSVEVTYRIDSKKARRKDFDESSDHKALGLWNGGNSIPFLKEMFGAKKLLIKAQPFSESDVQSEFNIDGIEQAIVPLRKACGW